MAGGHATQLGIRFQNQVAAWLAVYALAERSVTELGLPEGDAPVAISLETNAPVDDILVRTAADGFCFINAKTSVTLSDNTRSPLTSVFDQFVRQWLACSKGTGKRDWERPLDSARDRLVLALKAQESSAFISAAKPVLDRIKNSCSIHPQEDMATTKAQQRAYEVFIGLVKHYWLAHTGEEASDENVAALLGCIRIVSCDFENGHKSVALTLVREAVVADEGQAEAVWDLLVQTCSDYGSRRSGADRAGLREVLRGHGIALRDVPEFQADIRRLQEFTEETLERLAHLAHLCVPTPSGQQEITIDRPCIQALDHAARDESFLVIGEPGAGKSGALYTAALRLRQAGHPVMVIAVDQHPVATMADLEHGIGLKRPLSSVLRAWTTAKPGIFFIDALDASRGGPSDRVFQDLIRQILSNIPGWRVIASIRKFDLRFGVIYRELFRGGPVHPQFCADDFSTVRHLHIPRLSDDELAQVWAASPSMAEGQARGSDGLRELLRSPFNLYLFATILSSGGRVEELASVSTQVELLDRYWSHRAVDHWDRKSFNRESLLHDAAQRMIQKRELFVLKRDLQHHDGGHLYTLLSQGVLSPMRSRGDHITHVSFSHHMLFDYAVARLVLEGGHAPDLPKSVYNK